MERGIIFSDSMVRAIESECNRPGTGKTMTRRLICGWARYLRDRPPSYLPTKALVEKSQRGRSDFRHVTAKPRALDLFCCAGGAGRGLADAGFEVVGVDIEPQPRYPFEFHQADALTYPLEGFDFIWASPPCQKFCALATREDLSHYPDLIEPIRSRLVRCGTPFVIENVPGSPVRKDLILCGGMFGLRSYRHRHFECSFPITQPAHPKHKVRVNRRGENRRKHWASGGFITITGDVGVYCGPEAMGIDWMTGNEMSEAIPPAYAEYIGRAALAVIAASRKEAA